MAKEDIAKIRPSANWSFVIAGRTHHAHTNALQPMDQIPTPVLPTLPSSLSHTFRPIIIPLALTRDAIGIHLHGRRRRRRRWDDADVRRPKWKAAVW